MARYRNKPLSEVLKEYDSIVEVLDLESCTELMCLDELISWEDMIRDLCLEIVRANLDLLETRKLVVT